MAFAGMQGNENLIERLKRMIRSGRIFHGCIFEGKAEETGRLADSFVKAALCLKQDGDACGSWVSCRKFDSGNSEDVFSIGSEGTVRDKDVEALISAAMKKSYTGRPVFLMVRGAERMTLRAQNRLLKTLEEPPSGVKILLLTENAELLAQTVRSRCVLFRLRSEPGECAGGEGDSLSEEDRARAVGFARNILYGKPFYALSSDIAYFGASREMAERWTAEAELFFRDVLVSFFDGDGKLLIHNEERDIIRRCAEDFTPEQLAEAAACAENARRDLSFNVSAGRALKYMIFDIQEKLKGGF